MAARLQTMTIWCVFSKKNAYLRSTLLMMFVFLTHLFLHLQVVSSTMSSSIRVLDGDSFYVDGLDPQTDITIMCTNTNFRDGFCPSNTTIVDDNSKPFDAPTYTASRNCKVFLRKNE